MNKSLIIIIISLLICYQTISCECKERRIETYRLVTNRLFVSDVCDRTCLPGRWIPIGWIAAMIYIPTLDSKIGAGTKIHRPKSSKVEALPLPAIKHKQLGWLRFSDCCSNLWFSFCVSLANSPNRKCKKWRLCVIRLLVCVVIIRK
jgi:hypothetical protein